jgi:peptide/nickel transport system permease protein
VQAGVMAAALMVIVVNLAVDMLYGMIDPRIAK